MPPDEPRHTLPDRPGLRVESVRASAMPCDECRETIERHRREFDLPTEAALHVAVGALYGGSPCDHVEYDETDVARAYAALWHREMRERDRLRAENERLREDLGIAVYHAENLQRYINHVPVRDFSESRMAFANVKRGLALDETNLPEEGR